MQLLPMASSPDGLISARNAVITKTPGWEVLTTTRTVNVTQGHGWWLGGGGGGQSQQSLVDKGGCWSGAGNCRSGHRWYGGRWGLVRGGEGRPPPQPGGMARMWVKGPPVQKGVTRTSPHTRHRRGAPIGMVRGHPGGLLRRWGVLLHPAWPV